MWRRCRARQADFPGSVENADAPWPSGHPEPGRVLRSKKPIHTRIEAVVLTIGGILREIPVPYTPFACARRVRRRSDQRPSKLSVPKLAGCLLSPTSAVWPEKYN